MRRIRFTIAWLMTLTAVLGVDIGVARAFLFAEWRSEHLFPFGDSVFLIFFALQFGLWRYLSTEGRRRRFWLGFEVSGLAATLALITLFESNIDLDNWYTGAMSDLSYLCFPARVDVMLTNEHWVWFLAIINFLPELLAAAFGGLLATCLFKVNKTRADTIRPALAVQVLAP